MSTFLLSSSSVRFHPLEHAYRHPSLLTVLAMVVFATIASSAGGPNPRQPMPSADEVRIFHRASAHPGRAILDTAAATLAERLGVPAELAGRTGVRPPARWLSPTPVAAARAIRAAVTELSEAGAVTTLGLAWSAAADCLQTGSNRMLEAALGYRYAGLAVLLFVGALGLPVPSGLAAGMAGALIAQGSFSWAPTAATVMLASTLGDALGYAAGRLVGLEHFGRPGRLLGLIHARLARARPFVERSGWCGLLLSRTVLSAAGPAVNLVAGTSRVSALTFLACELIGRGAWTATYLALGYSLG